MSSYTKRGIAGLGFIKDIRNFTDPLKELIAATQQVADQATLDDAVDEQFCTGTLEYLNKFGYRHDRDGLPYTLKTANFIVFDTQYVTAEGRHIYGWFYRNRPDMNYTGIEFGTRETFKRDLKDKSSFRLGDFMFETWNDAFAFLDDLAENTIPERWTYNYSKSSLPHPILKAYIENVFQKLKNEENKILVSDDMMHMVFNSNLLDKYFHEIYIMAQVEIEDDEFVYRNPARLKSLSDLIKLGFRVNGHLIKSMEKLPSKPCFFTDINQIIFHTGWVIDRSFERFEHIIEERRDRFPEAYRTKKTDDLARLLDGAINYAVAIAERNYKFIVPQYRPQDDKLQLLMPIYLSGSFTEKPDFSLILDPDATNQLYTPQTILSLDAAYQNARVIAKPDEYWLNPAII